MKKSVALTIIVFMLFSLAVPLIKVEPAQAAISGSFGYTTIGGTLGRNFGNVMVGAAYNSGTEDVYVTGISWYGKTTDSTPVKALIVDATTKAILATSSVASTSTTEQWYNHTFASHVAVSASTNYYLMLITSGNYIDVYYDGSGTSLVDTTNSYSSPSNPTDGSAGTKKYSIYATYYAYEVALTADPAISASVTVDGGEQDFPYSFNCNSATHTYLAERTIVSGDTVYFFDYWLINGTTINSAVSLHLAVSGDTNITATYDSTSISGGGVFFFYGPLSEATGLQLDETVTVTIYYSDAASDSFSFNGTYIFEPSGTTRYVLYTFTDNSTREYWVDPSETVTVFYIFHGDTQTYTLYFMDYTSVLATYPYITAQTYINGSYFSVEKKKVDAENTFTMNLIEGQRYQLLIGNEDYTYVYGDYTPTSTTTVQLILKGTDFPKETLLMYPYLTLYANRTFVSGSDAPIIIRYLDSKDETLNFTITFTDQNGVNAYTYTVVSSDITLTWNSAVDTNSYTVSAEIEHTTYGTYTWKQYLQAEGGSPVSFDLSFLGSWSIDLTYFIPIILIVIVAGCFSAMNAEVGAIVAAILAVILTYMGWIPIAPGMLVTALSLAILMALVYNKRRIQPY